MKSLFILFYFLIIGKDQCQSEEQIALPNCLKTATTNNIRSYPWFLPIHYDGHYRCGAVVVSNEVLLTAAHCVLSLRHDLITVHLPDGSERKAIDVIMHEAYDAYHKNHDVAIIRLNQKIVFDQSTSPVCLPLLKQDPAGKPGRILGWRFHPTSNSTATALLQVNVSVYSHTECTKMKYKPAAISGYMLCAGNVNRDICQGDTSGPLVVQNEEKWEIVGVTSWSEECGKSGYPQVYTKLLHYVDWICIKMRVMKVENVECHCSLHRPMTCPSCGHGYVGEVTEIDTDCGGSGQEENLFSLARSMF